METLRIKGGKPLRGRIKVSGAKNAALPIFAATLLTDQTCTIENVPDLSDVHFMVEILRYLGAEVVRKAPDTWQITAKNIDSRAPYNLVRKMRASVCLLGPLVGRLRHCQVSLPGGCIIGPRPIDLHLKGLTKLGCSIKIEKGYICVDGHLLKGGNIFLGGRHGSTVTGTANMIMAAVLTKGLTKIESAACEPEIIDLCHFLQKMGAHIEGVGSHNLKIEGVSQLKGCYHSIINDRIEAGTFLIASAITKGDLIVEGANCHHLSALLDKFEEASIPFDIEGPSSIRVNNGADECRPIDIITLHYPGLATDLQAQMCALMAVTPGLSIITERVYPNRYMHVPELQRMGADIAIEGASAIINGKKGLSGAPVMASDLRASAALVLAGLAAEGETWIHRVYHLVRGYEHLDQKLKKVGAEIESVSAEMVPYHLWTGK